MKKPQFQLSILHGKNLLKNSARKCISCAVITSRSSGLNETFDNNLILKKNNEKN